MAKKRPAKGPNAAKKPTPDDNVKALHASIAAMQKAVDVVLGDYKRAARELRALKKKHGENDSPPAMPKPAKEAKERVTYLF